MDIKNKRTFLSFSKRFTLKATASAILALNADIVLALDYCPAQIIGSAYADIICEFNPNTTSSVTVENEGTVGGIALNGPDVPTPPSKIVVNSGGLISNTAMSSTSTGIFINNSVLSDGIINNGTIDIVGIGLLISNGSAINDGISNNSSIITSSTSINISTSIESGGISNSGLLQSSSRTALLIKNSSIINGGISNSGSIITNGMSVVGLVISNSQIHGGITNSGLIQANSAASLDNSMTLHQSSAVIGDILNTSSGIMQADQSGIYLAYTDLTGSIINNGSILATASAGIKITQGGHIYDNSGDSGNISNQGTISAGQDAIFVTSNSLVAGTINNSGEIHGGEHGIAVSISSVVSHGITNSGSLSGSDTGIAMFSNVSISGNINNSGSLSSSHTGVALFSGGIVNGDINNSGSLSGLDTGIAVYNSGTVNGAIINSGTIQGDTKGIYISADDSAVSGIDITGQHARIIGAVDAQSTDFNIKSEAVFTSEGNFNVSNFTIESDALFYMAHSITTRGIVNNTGTLSVGNTTQNTTAYTQNAGGIFQLGITDSTHYGHLTVSSAVDLLESGNIDVQVAQNATIYSGEVFSNIISGDTLAAPTNGYHVTDNNFIWQFTANTNATAGVDLTATINPAVNNVCQGSYQESGSPMSLSVASNSNASLVLGAYCNAAYHLFALNSQPNLAVTSYVGVNDDVLNNQPQTLATFIAGGGSFSTFGVQFNKPVFRGGAGLTLASSTLPLSIALNYDAQVGNNAFSGVAEATIKYKA